MARTLAGLIGALVLVGIPTIIIYLTFALTRTKAKLAATEKQLVDATKSSFHNRARADAVIENTRTTLRELAENPLTDPGTSAMLQLELTKIDKEKV